MVTEDMKENPAENEEVATEERDPVQYEEFISASSDSDKVADPETPGSDTSENLAAEVKEWQDKYLRLSAEFDNYRKRTWKEKMDLIASGGEDVIKSMLAVLDDMGRAVTATEESDDIESARQGMKLIRQKMVDALRQKGVTEIPALGEPLDTDLHEAVAKFPAEEDRKGKIIDVVQKGYKLKDKVVRFAKVVVGE